MPSRNQWAKKAAEHLVGRKITGVRYLSEGEKEGLGWDRASLVIQLDNHTLIFAASDDEGNGPGALFTNLNDLPKIPVV